MFVTVNVCEQTVPCGTSPKLWTMTGGGVCSRLVAMSGRKNLLAHGDGGRLSGCGLRGCGAFVWPDAPTDAIRPNRYSQPDTTAASVVSCMLEARSGRRRMTLP